MPRSGYSVVSGSDDSTVRVWDASTGQELLVLEGHEGGVTSVAVSPDGLTILSGSVDTTVRVWSPTTGPVRKLVGHTSIVHAVAIAQAHSPAFGSSP